MKGFAMFAAPVSLQLLTDYVRLENQLPGSLQNLQSPCNSTLGSQIHTWHWVVINRKRTCSKKVAQMEASVVLSAATDRLCTTGESVVAGSLQQLQSACSSQAGALG